MSPELETLNQLAAGDLPVIAARHLFPSVAAFATAMTAMLAAGEVQLVYEDDCLDDELPEWKWISALTEIEFSNPYDLRITPVGRNRLQSETK